MIMEKWICEKCNIAFKKFAEEVIEECAAFPFGDHDDYVDSMTQALMRIRQGGLVLHPEDYKDEPVPKKRVEYYG